MLTITKLEIRDRPYPTVSGSSYREYSSKPRCYVFPKGETILENLFVGRRARPFELYKAEVIPAVKAAIVERVIDMGRNLYDFDEGDISVRWSQKAGCACGCSPAFIITISRGDPQPFDVFVDVEATDGGNAAAVTADAEEALEGYREYARQAASQRTARSGAGNLRNLKAMSDEKFTDVGRAVQLENNDPEAIEACRVEAARRGW